MVLLPLLSLLTLFLLLMAAGNVNCRPYFGETFTFYQPDGKEFQVRLFGDEFYATVETLDGYTLTRDPVTGFYCYAQLDSTSNSFKSTAVHADTDIPMDVKLTKGIRLSPKTMQEKSDIRRKKFGVGPSGKLLPAEQLRLRPRDFGHQRWSPALEKEAQALESSATSIQAPPTSTTSGTLVGLTLLARFSDRLGDATLTQTQVDAFANDPSYTEFGNATSVYGYYKQQSNDFLNYNNIVTAYFAAAHERSYYSHGPGTARDLVKEGLAALKASGFDFSKVDANADGVLDGVNLFYAGICPNNWGEGLWPHKGTANWAGLATEGVSTRFQYQISDMDNQLTIGTFCHENGHMLCNFPDLYSYDDNAAAIRSYSLMASSGNTHPVSIDSYLKLHAGWSSIIPLSSVSHMRGALEVDKNTFYRFNNPSNSKEYFLLSMRTDAGYEGIWGGATKTANPTDGLVIWHAYEEGSNTYSSIFTEDSAADNTDYSTPYELMVVESNPSSATVPWYDDPTPGLNDSYHSGDVQEASDTTTPALKFWDTASGRTTPSGLHLHAIGQQGDNITFTVGSGNLTTPPSIGTTSSQFTPRCDQGSDCQSQQFAIFNRGGDQFSYAITDNVPWLQISPASGSVGNEADQITVSYDTDSLTPGMYSGRITIHGSSATTNLSKTIPVWLTIYQPPAIQVDRTAISLTLLSGETKSAVFKLANSGGGTLRYSLTGLAPWIGFDSPTGTVKSEEDTITVNMDTSGMREATYYSNLKIESGMATNSPQFVDVQMHVKGILISSPNGGETLWRGNKHDIRWRTGNSVTGSIKIELYRNGVVHSTIATDTLNDGRFHWSIPTDLPTSGSYTIRISSVNEPSIKGASDAGFSITTMPFLTTIPYNESFERGSPGDWHQSNDDHFDWTVNSGATPSIDTGPSAASDGNFYIYTEATGNFPGKTATIQANFDLRNVAHPLLTFSYHMYGEAMGELAVRASTDQLTWTTLYTRSDNHFNYWLGDIVDLSPYVDKAVTIQITGTTADSFTSDMALDNIRIDESNKALSYSIDTFRESADDDGSIRSTAVITLGGDTFTSTATSIGNLTVLNLPPGLRLSAARVAPTRINLSLLDNAINHDCADSLENLIVRFGDGAFTGRMAVRVAGSTQSLAISYTTKPDLTVNNAQISANAFPPETLFTFSADVVNQSTAIIQGSTLRYYLSDDSTLSSSDTVVATDTVSVLSGGETSLEQAVIRAPSDLGTYWVGACVDTVTGETQTSNQCTSAIEISIIQPDLIVSDFSVTGSEFTAGSSYLYAMTAIVKNQGTDTSEETRLRYYISSDNIISSDDYELLDSYFSPLYADQTVTRRASLTLPAIVGSYWLGACIDPKPDESNINNQCSSGQAITIIQPDLYISRIFLSRKEVGTDDPFTLTLTVKNRGTAPAPASTIRYYLSRNTIFQSDNIQLQTTALPAIDTQSTFSTAVSLTAPAFEWDYWLVACIDPVVGEPDSNQCSRTLPLRVHSFPWNLYYPAITGKTGIRKKQPNQETKPQKNH